MMGSTSCVLQLCMPFRWQVNQEFVLWIGPSLIIIRCSILIPGMERKQQPGRAGDEAPPEEQPGANATSVVSVATTLHVVIIGESGLHPVARSE